MENSRRDLGRRVGLLCFVFTVFILFGCTIAENRIDPTANVNLSPIQGWRSAHWCMLNFMKKSTCSTQNLLTEGGVLDVSSNEKEEFCKSGGCADQTRDVLTCIHHVKRNYWFANKATVQTINAAIDQLCPSPPTTSG